jgi:predicted MFS family arabinose efflux permease
VIGLKPARRFSPPTATALGASVTVVALLPMFFVGAMSVEISTSLGIDSAGIGLVVGLYHVVGVATAMLMGRVVDRIGSTWAVRLAAGVAALTGIGIATSATSLLHLAAWMMIGGCANTLAQPASNRLLATSIPGAYQGVAFGIKQTAPPVASMLGGLAVPAVALTVGWEAAYLLAAGLAVLVILGAGRRPAPGNRAPRPERARLRREDRPAAVWLSASIGLAAAASATVFTFYVQAAVEAGSSQSAAGLMLAVAAGASVTTRLACGFVSDRLRGGHLRLCTGLLTVGTVGIALLATGHPALMAPGAVAALAGTWGLNGVFWYVVVRAFSYAPGTATGTVSQGLLLGATLSPLGFGWLARSYGITSAWLLSLVLAVLAVVAMLRGSHHLAGVTQIGVTTQEIRSADPSSGSPRSRDPSDARGTTGETAADTTERPRRGPGGTRE